MTIINQSALESAKVMLVFDKKPALPQLTKYAQYVTELGPLLYISITDSPKDFTKKGIQKAVVADSFSQIHEIAKQGSVNIVVDTKGELFEFLGRDSSLWKERGVLVHDGVKYVCGERWDSIRRECVSKKLVESEFQFTPEDVQIKCLPEANKEFSKLVKQNAEVICDIESDSLYFEQDTNILTIQFTFPSEPLVSFILQPQSEDMPDMVKWLFTNKRIVGHNFAAFDLPWICRRYGIDPFDVDLRDTMMMAHTLYNSTEPIPIGLKPLSFKYFGEYEYELDQFKERYITENKITKDKFNYGLIPFHILSRYAAVDTSANYHLYRELLESWCYTQENLTYVDNVATLVASMTLNGVPVNLSMLKEEDARLDEEIAKVKEQLLHHPDVIKTENFLTEKQLAKDFETYNKKCKEAELKGKKFTGKQPVSKVIKFNPGSSDHLRTLLFEVVGLKPTEFTDKDTPRTDKKTLEKIIAENSKKDLQILKVFGEYFKLTKLSGTYSKPFISRSEAAFDGRVRGSIRFLKSLRFGMKDLALNTIPKDAKLREIIRTDDPNYVFITADFSSLEFQLAGILSGELKMLLTPDPHSFAAINSFPELSGYDCENPAHLDEVKSKYKKLRDLAKTVNFGSLYGASAQTVHEQSGAPLKLCEVGVQNFWTTFAKLTPFFNAVVEQGYKEGYIEIFKKFRLYCPSLQSHSRKIVSGTERTLKNAVIQSGATLTNEALIRTYRRVKELRLDAKLLLQIHDDSLNLVHIKDAVQFACILQEEMEKDFMENQPKKLEAVPSVGYYWKEKVDLVGDYESKTKIFEEFLKGKGVKREEDGFEFQMEEE